MRKEQRPGNQGQPSRADTPRAWKRTQLGYKDLDKTDQSLSLYQYTSPTRTTGGDEQKMIHPETKNGGIGPTSDG